MAGNLLIVHGGGPTAVMNSTLYGVITEAKKNDKVIKVLAAIGGSQGILTENFLALSDISDAQIDLLLQTPGTAIGSSRFALEQADYEQMVQVFKHHNIKYVLFNGGNGTMDTCGKVHEVCKEHDIHVVGIPKTVDNDLSIIDHAPGYASAARYMAAITAEIGADVKSLPIHVCVIEAMGRNAGWITAASALAKKNPEDVPHLIYLPEVSFDEEQFLIDVKKIYDEKGYAVVVVSEGLRNKEGESIVPPIFRTERAIYYGDVSAYLAKIIIQKLGIKARNEKPGICFRSSIAYQSKIDRDEAVLVGKEAVKAVVSGETGVMVGIVRKEGNEYGIKTPLIPIKEVMMHEKILPCEYINETGNGITDDFIEWCRPLIGEELREFINFNDK